jgi:hypothetical protein
VPAEALLKLDPPDLKSKWMSAANATLSSLASKSWLIQVEGLDDSRSDTKKLYSFKAPIHLGAFL